ncbi:MAG: hypothetical protein J7J01_02690 [Methanophagales archaeon]|nr:hypothetical protein [Methanophagales archaeon]
MEEPVVLIAKPLKGASRLRGVKKIRYREPTGGEGFAVYRGGEGAYHAVFTPDFLKGLGVGLLLAFFAFYLYNKFKASSPPSPPSPSSPLPPAPYTSPPPVEK